MEVSNGAVLKSLSCCYSGVGKDTHIGKSISTNYGGCFRRGIRFPRFRELKFRALARPGNWNCVFEDKGHLDYYTVSPVCGEVKEKRKGKGKKGWNGVSSKKRMNLLKGFVKDLATFSELGFGLEVNCDEGLVGEDEKGKMISQAAETLLAQLKQLRVEEEEMKKMQKQEKQKSKTQDSESSSSSESSESSDSECDAVVDMNRLRNKAVDLQPVKTEENLLLTRDSSSLPTPTPTPTPTPSSDQSRKVEQECCNMILEATLAENATIEVLKLETPCLEQPKPSSIIGSPMMASPRGRRIEVCMGGKCKKSGAPALIEEFEKMVGEEGAVVGCKCMGKCKSGPNVRVMNGEDLVDDSLRTPSNPLYIGVGLEDVELIVASCFGEENKGLGLAVAPLHS